MNRRTFIAFGTLAGAAAKAKAGEPAGFFSVAQRNGRWWFITPDDRHFFSLGLNHIDPAVAATRRTFISGKRNTPTAPSTGSENLSGRT